MSAREEPAVWFPAVCTGSGTDVFTKRLISQLKRRGLRAEVTWLPHRAEYAPWTVRVPKPPSWANVAHVNTWLHPRFVPRNLHVVATIHHSMNDPALAPYKGSMRSFYHRHWMAPIERSTVARAKLIVAVSHFAARVSHAAMLDYPIRVIYNGVDTEKFRPPIKRSSHENFRLLYVGKWGALKGVDLLSKIMHRLGDGFELRYTGGPAAECDLANPCKNMLNIGRLQSLDDVIAAMQDADAFLFPSRSEGFGLAVAEAMACGLPVIATRGSSLPEVVEDGVTGILCDKNDIEAFERAARKLASTRSTRIVMAEAARERVIHTFSERNMTDHYIEVYREAMG